MRRDPCKISQHYNPQQQLNQKLVMLRTAAQNSPDIQRENTSQCENLLKHTHTHTQSSTKMSKNEQTYQSLIAAALLLFPVCPALCAELPCLHCVTVPVSKPQACVVHIYSWREMQRQGNKGSVRREKSRQGDREREREREGHFMAG